MIARRIELRDFRNYEHAAVDLPAGLTVVAGPNGAGKTNLLEAIYFGCTARSPRTASERELIRRGAAVTRVELRTASSDAEHLIEVGFEPGEPKRLRVDGRPLDTLAGLEQRPLASVFLPDRLELVKGAPSARRAHLDQVVSALWPSRAGARPEYSRALAQRNALLLRVRAGATGPATLDAWDAELARRGVELIAGRAEVVEALAAPYAALASRLGLPGAATLSYRPRSGATDAEALARELAERRQGDIERGFTTHGPHRDDLVLSLGGASLRSYGSQGQQRTALLALLFAERNVLAERRSRPPLMLLDDVMSELDARHRALLAEILRDGGQAVITTTDTAHVPGRPGAGDGEVHVEDGALGAGLRAAAA